MDEATKARLKTLAAERALLAAADAATENPEAAAKAAEDAKNLAAKDIAFNPTKIISQERQPAVVVAGTEKPALKTINELDADPLANLRIFRSRIPGSSFVFREGYTVYFTHGWYETTDPSEIQQLDAVANKTPAIYTDEHEADIVAAILQARREGFTGSIAEAMTQQISIEQRVAALRLGSGGAGKPLNLPTIVPDGAGLTASTTTAADAADMDSKLRAAIVASKSAAAQSNG